MDWEGFTKDEEKGNAAFELVPIFDVAGTGSGLSPAGASKNGTDGRRSLLIAGRVAVGRGSQLGVQDK
jgi:hypothetical protein